MLVIDAALQAASLPTAVPAAGGGIIDLINQKITEGGNLAKAGASLFFVVMALRHIARHEMRLVPSLMAIIAAAGFTWAIWNITTIENLVGNDVNAGKTGLVRLVDVHDPVVAEAVTGAAGTLRS